MHGADSRLSAADLAYVQQVGGLEAAQARLQNGGGGGGVKKRDIPCTDTRLRPHTHARCA
jgi:hypothetical protein